jgi:hypothetical protein
MVNDDLMEPLRRPVPSNLASNRRMAIVNCSRRPAMLSYGKYGTGRAGASRPSRSVNVIRLPHGTLCSPSWRHLTDFFRRLMLVKLV